MKNECVGVGLGLRRDPTPLPRHSPPLTVEQRYMYILERSLGLRDFCTYI